MATTKDMYATVFEKIQETIDKTGKLPWQQPWPITGRPKSYVTKKEYNGINLLVLGYTAKNYANPYFMTYKQGAEMGAKVIPGQKGSPVYFWNLFPNRSEVDRLMDEQNLTKEEAEKQARKFANLKYYTVFNYEQFQGLPPMEDDNDNVRIYSADDIIADMGDFKPNIKAGVPGYNPVSDTISILNIKKFNNTEAYYQTLFHELIHATGHMSRLNRYGDSPETSMFGSESYSREELVAEIGSAFLMTYCGLTPNYESSASYLQSWLTRLQKNPRELFSAYTAADKAAEYVVQFQNLKALEMV